MQTVFVFHSKDRESFLRQLEETETWLYEDGEDETRQVYADRLSALRVCSVINNIGKH